MCIAGKSGTKIKLHLEFSKVGYIYQSFVLSEFNFFHLIIKDQFAITICAKHDF
jgi:hypothetical protein